MRRQYRITVFSLYTKPSELAIEIVFYWCITPPCHKINLVKRPFRGRCSERLDDAFVLLIKPYLPFFPD